MTNPTAAIILIGNELLSGSVPDLNFSHIAKQLEKNGIKTNECRIIPDNEYSIISTVNELRKNYTYVFTTGGIGPTHDDITTKSIAEAFNLKIERNEEIENLFYQHYKGKVNSEMLQMADFPKGSVLIENKVTIAPGFQVENVFCLAGVPKIMQSMLTTVIPRLSKGNEIYTRSIDALIGESTVSHALGEIQDKISGIEIGSYPFKAAEGHGTSLVVKGVKRDFVEEAYKLIKEMLNSYDAKIRK